VGRGAAVILTKGKSQAGTWVRNGHGATHYRDSKGKDILLAPGPVWILLVPTSGSVTLG
jgi:hypothetical protein